MMATGAKEEVVEVGYLERDKLLPCDELSAGMVGYITASIKNVKDSAVGDTVTDDNNPAQNLCPVIKRYSPWYIVDYIPQTVPSTRI